MFLEPANVEKMFNASQMAKANRVPLDINNSEFARIVIYVFTGTDVSR